MTPDPACSPGDVEPDTPSSNWLALTLHSGLGARGFAARALEGDPQAAGAARLFARSTLFDWDMDALVDSAAVIVSELVSNAMRYGLTNPQNPPVSSQPVWLGLLLQEKTVLCAVSDPSPEVPVVKEPDYLAESGRGLHIIDSLSDAWGWTSPDHAGKTVWAEVGLPAPL
jgi:anti-sigma regulatory factor (Ser/Thr protein kinase)